MAIFFHDEDANARLNGKRKIQKWLNDVIKNEGKVPGRISIILTSDKKLLEINRQYLSRNYLTDIITFDYTEGVVINGDLFISVERVIENSGVYKTKKEEELRRVMVHGILHLAGYGDSGDEEAAEMRSLENFYLEQFPDSK